MKRNRRDNAGAMLVLGAAVWAQGPSPTLRRRTEHAATLWHAGAAPVIIPCGGLGQHPPAEAHVMRDLLLEHGVPADAIICEDASTNTLENIQFALPHLIRNGVQDVMIVTDATHGPRAAMVARRLGLRPRVSSPSLRGTHTGFFLRQVLREAGAMPLYAWRLRKFRKPESAAPTDPN